MARVWLGNRRRAQPPVMHGGVPRIQIYYADLRADFRILADTKYQELPGACMEFFQFRSFFSNITVTMFIIDSLNYA